MGQPEHIIKTEYAEVMQQSYIDYAMSVIISRALPDIRDGLKPVQRRTLYDMYELGIRYDRPYRKCARIVGDTMGKYHPHGDSSIYEALVVMSQDFKRGQPLIDGHGNFGSIEGDGAAAMRYTEARLEKITQEVYLRDLDQNVVDFVPNFDETEREPEVLPVRIPNFLVNGAEGIAVGMATSVPPHNLAEVVDGMIAYIRNPEITTEELMLKIKGPDFPTGGIVVNQDDLRSIYEKGTGKLRLRGRVATEEIRGGRKRLVITEIPYTMVGANIGKFLNEVAALVETRVTNDITDISNQSSKEGIRIVIELRRGADPEQITNLLYRKTRLEDSFGVNMLAVAGGRPETLGLKQVLEYQTDFQFDMTTRRYQNMLARELDKKEVQEGLIRACDIIDLIIEILRGSRSQKQVKSCLTEGLTEGIRFKTKKSERAASKLHFTERQAQAILDMRLAKLIGLEIEALQLEHEKTLANIARYQEILDRYDVMADVIIRDLEAIRDEYGRPRRTALENAGEAVYVEQEAEETEVCVLMDRFGYIRTVDRAVFEKQRENVVKDYSSVLCCGSRDRLCIFTEQGSMHTVKVSDLPYGKMKDKGAPVDNFGNYSNAKERILLMTCMSGLSGQKLFFATKSGMIKLVDGSEFVVSKRTIAATKLVEGDELVFVGLAATMEYVVLVSHTGQFLRFALGSVPEKKKAAIGVRGIRLAGDDSLERAYLIESRSEYTISWRDHEVALNRLKIGKRDTKGVKIRI